MNPPDHRQRDKTLEFISIAALLAFSLFLVLGSDRIADLLLSFDRSTSFETTMKSNMHSKEPSKFKGFKNGVVATEHEICSQVGIGLMRAGGSAVDASIGSLLCVGVLHNFASGIGGGGVMLVQTSEDKNNPKVIDFRETAPASASEDMFIGPGGREKATVSVHSIAIPGEIGGFAEAHRRWGILKWKDIFEPAIRIASLGFPASRKLEEMVNKNIKLIMADSGLRKTFIKEDGTPIKTGNIIIRPELAKTLQIIAEEGEDAFYKPGGSIATKIIDFFLKKSKQSDTVITFKDLADYKIVVRDAIKISIPDGYEIISSGAPTSGAVVLQALAVIKRLGHVADEKITLQRMIEALKFAYADRMKLGDPAFVAEMNDFVEDMISPTRIDLISGRITDVSFLSRNFHTYTIELKKIIGKLIKKFFNSVNSFL